jgi:hypothetical protein
VIDVAPTILERAGLPQPTEVSGFKQHPIEGVSMSYSFDDSKAADRHTTQYFEINANRGIYHDGWFAGTVHLIPWITKTSPVPLAEDKWELYDVNADFSLSNDLAASNPAKLKEMQDVFMAEATKYHVLPIDGRYVERFNPKIAGRPEAIPNERKSMDLYEGMALPGADAIFNTKNRSFQITADIEVPEGKPAQGVLLALGGGLGGWSLYVKDGKPEFDLNYLAQEHFTISSAQALAPGRRTVKYVFDYDGDGIGKGGTSTLFVDGTQVATGKVTRTPCCAGGIEGMEVGFDMATPVTDAYPAGSANRFNGKIMKMVIGQK